MPSDSPANLSIASLCDLFVRERRYLQNVAPKTLAWYACSRRAFQPLFSSVRSEADLAPAARATIMEMAASEKLCPTSINDYARCMNAFFRWLHSEKYVSMIVTIPKLKTAKRVVEILTWEQITRLIRLAL